jgi:hypothetical protein
MPIFKVEVDYQHRCAGETFWYIIFASDKADAKLQAIRATDGRSNLLMGGDKYDYTIEEIEVVNIGVILVSHDYWER